MTEKYVINFDHVTKKFENFTALNDLTIKMPENKITTVLGFSGAGKSTFLKHILGLLIPSSGSVEVLGKEINQLDQLERREFRKNFGMVFQYAALFDSLSAVENVAFPLKEFSNLPLSKIYDQAKNLLISVGIAEESFYKLPSELSGGMRKRVGLARALALSPKIMLYDEPTTGLDPITTKMVNDLIIQTAAKHRERGLTSVIISHDVKATLEISDYVAFLDRGRIVEYLPAQEFKHSDNEMVKEFINL